MGEVPKHDSGWEASYLLGCPPVDILGGRTYIHMRCALQLCPDCVNQWKDVVPQMELDCSERISYFVFGTHSKCSYHGNTEMQVEGKEHICRACETMSDERKSKLKRGTPRVKQVRLQIMLTEMMSNFMKPGGTYKTYLWKMLFHSTHVKLLGSRFCMSMVHDYAATTDGLIVCEMDYSERYQPMSMHKIQSENFGKDKDVSMEIRIVTYTGRFDGPNSALTKQVILYGHISDEKLQIAATTLFEDIHHRQELTEKNYFLIILITDGCTGQYKSGTATFMLAMHAQATGKIFFQVVKCARHGKCHYGAERGCHKTFCDEFFDRHVITP